MQDSTQRKITLFKKLHYTYENLKNVYVCMFVHFIIHLYIHIYHMNFSNYMKQIIHISVLNVCFIQQLCVKCFKLEFCLLLKLDSLYSSLNTKPHVLNCHYHYYKIYIHAVEAYTHSLNTKPHVLNCHYPLLQNSHTLCF